MLSIPTTSEYAPFYQNYIQKVGTAPVLELLENQIHTTVSYFHGLTEEDFSYRYAPGKWSVAEVLGHMVDTEWIMATRALRISRREAQP